MKTHGAGNDFILLPDPDDAVSLDAAFVRALCDRRRGVGGDGVIRLAPARPSTDADVFMDYWNADGSIAEMCGNGVRCVAKYVADHGWHAGDHVRIDTRDGVKVTQVVRRAGDKVASVRVDMGAPVIGVVDEPLDVDGLKAGVTTVSMGNPHAVIVVDDVDGTDLDHIGPALQRHEMFTGGTNVEVISVPTRELVEGRIWERGVGETLASGTGASAMAAAAMALDLTDRIVDVRLPGGTLHVERTDDTLFVTGDAVEVAEGELDAAWLTTI